MAVASDSVLLQRLLRNDPTAWREIVTQYSGLLLAISRRTFLGYGYLPANQDCEDVVAEVWCNLLENNRAVVRRCLARGYFLPTLQVLARNRSIDMLRRRKLISVPMADEENTLAAPEPELVVDPDRAALLPKALEVLSPKEKTLVQLFFLQEKKYREIERLTGIPQNSIGPTLARALLKLRKAISESESAPAPRA
jgi:RNA polymerase sigma-70 factor, ECF subfamily